MSLSPFDVLAPAYDTDFTATPIAEYLRGLVHRRLKPLLSKNIEVLELGCGTGEDACAVAKMGANVVATDASHRMLDISRHKTEGLSVQVAYLDLTQPQTSGIDRAFQGVYSNFGALNCCTDRSGLAAWLAQHITPGGWAAFGVMPPWCVWEMLWHALHGEFAIAKRRWTPVQFQIKDSPPVTVDCPHPRQLIREFAPWFEPVSVLPLGVIVPHSSAYPVIEKRKRLLTTLIKLDTMVSDVGLLAQFSDHYWITLRRRHE